MHMPVPAILFSFLYLQHLAPHIYPLPTLSSFALSLLDPPVDLLKKKTFQQTVINAFL